MRNRSRLSTQAFLAYFAGRYAERRDYWMGEARSGMPELKPLHVSFARAAHRAYLNNLRRVSST